MAVIRAQAILKAVTGMARDNCVNTFHFNGLISEANLTGIANAVRDFYVVEGAEMVAVGDYLSTAVSNVQVKLYDVTNEPSGPPLLTTAEVSVSNGRLGGANLPEEVAVAMSFAGTPEAGLDQARRRGRIYVGPLRDACVTYQVGAGVKVSTAFRDKLLERGAALATQVDPFAEWVVYSRPYAGRGEIVRPGRSTLPAIAARPGTTVNIDQVSVDDAPDTQRRRGPRPTLRTIVNTTA